MGIFTRLRDIISSNLNAMLDMAEDPEKMIKLMIQEMEDTLVEIKASCAGAMAQAKKIDRQLEQALRRVDEWAAKAQLAVNKGREDLAREALIAKRSYARTAEILQRELAEAETVVRQYQADIVQLEEKLAEVRERQRVLVQRHIHARQQKRARQNMRRADSPDVILRFEMFKSRIERLEAEAEMENFGRRPPLEDEFERLVSDDEIERELAALKKSQDEAQA